MAEEDSHSGEGDHKGRPYEMNSRPPLTPDSREAGSDVYPGQKQDRDQVSPAISPARGQYASSYGDVGAGEPSS